MARRQLNRVEKPKSAYEFASMEECELAEAEHGPATQTISGTELSWVLAWMTRESPKAPRFDDPGRISVRLRGLAYVMELMAHSSQLGDHAALDADALVALSQVIWDQATQIEVQAPEMDFELGTEVTIAPAAQTPAAGGAA